MGKQNQPVQTKHKDGVIDPETLVIENYEIDSVNLVPLKEVQEVQSEYWEDK